MMSADKPQEFALIGESDLSHTVSMHCQYPKLKLLLEDSERMLCLLASFRHLIFSDSF